MDLNDAKESITGGVLLLILGLIIQFILKSTIYSFNDKKNKDNYFMEVFLFITGVVGSLIGIYIFI